MKFLHFSHFLMEQTDDTMKSQLDFFNHKKLLQIHHCIVSLCHRLSIFNIFLNSFQQKMTRTVLHSSILFSNGKWKVNYFLTNKKQLQIVHRVVFS
jgi:hypothetical protein